MALRTTCCALTLLGALAVPSMRAEAQTAHAAVWDRTRFAGQIAELIGPKNNPTGLSVQTGLQSTDVRIGPNTVYEAKTAEAEVEGLTENDYTVVTAKRSPRGWTAVRVQYDVQPFGPLRIVAGTINKVEQDERRFSLRLDPTHLRWITLNKLTRLRVDGRLVDTPGQIERGATVQVLALRTELNWVALDVNVKVSTLLHS